MVGFSCGDGQLGEGAVRHLHARHILESGERHHVGGHADLFFGISFQDAMDRCNPVLGAWNIEAGKSHGAEHSIIGLKRPCHSSHAFDLDAIANTFNLVIAVDVLQVSREVVLVKRDAAVGA